MIYTCTIETPLGAMTAAVQDEALIGLWFIGQKYYPTAATNWIWQAEHSIFGDLERHLSRYFSGAAGSHELPLAPQGSPFQKAVWEALTRIPYGETVTYAAIAKEIARELRVGTMSAQ